MNRRGVGAWLPARSGGLNCQNEALKIGGLHRKNGCETKNKKKNMARKLLKS